MISEAIIQEQLAYYIRRNIAEQAEVLEQLRSEGYEARFAIGLDDARKIVDEYLGGCE